MKRGHFLHLKDNSLIVCSEN